MRDEGVHGLFGIQEGTSECLAEGGVYYVCVSEWLLLFLAQVSGVSEWDNE